MVQVHGACADEFARLRSAFTANFDERGDVGAALAVVVDGALVVDIWAGIADPASGRTWEAATAPNIWSTTKGVTAACFAMLHDRGRIDYDAPVASYWPEFGASGKEAVTVAMLLSHQAGLCGFREPATVDAFYDARRAADRLAAQKPFWAPGAQSGYHAISIGFLADALFERAEGRSLRQFVAEELGHLGISIGLSVEQEPFVATMVAPSDLTSSMPGELTTAQVAALANPPLDPLLPNSAAWRAAEIPSANGFATARGLAKLYGALVGDGLAEGQKIAGSAAVAAATRERIRGIDAVLGVPSRWGAGFLCNTDGLYGPNPRAFGHSGWGGSFAFADPDLRMGFAYTMNRMGTDLVGDPRNAALLESVY